MSNSLAIAAVTATLKNLLNGAISANVADSVPNAKATTLHPSSKQLPNPGLNVFLFQVTPNPALRNLDAPTRRSDGTLIQRPQSALDLHYLFSFYGDEAKWEPQRLAAITVRTLDTQAVLTPDIIRQSITTLADNDNQFNFLRKSDLADSVERVRVTPEAVPVEEMSKLWSVFFQTQYALSVAYRASVVLIEAPESPSTPLPVRVRAVYAVASAAPTVTSVAASPDETAPIIPQSLIAVHGSNLSGDDAFVLVGSTQIPLGPASFAGDTASVTLPAGLSAGVLGVQVVHRIAMGDPPVPHRGAESNVYPIVLHPLVTSVAKANVQPTTIAAVVYYSADVTIGLTPGVKTGQRVVLLLNAIAPAPAPPAVAYTFAAPPIAADSGTVAVKVRGVRAGTYLVRAQVDGAPSVPLAADGGAYKQVVFP
ncbi:MAG TPA: DUF4255 domain-containing protein [Myxococcota bacterium]|jgi:hypothetical protein|nr:DUF4255 domain-containing protein [Myxococcota bacterium]